MRNSSACLIAIAHSRSMEYNHYLFFKFDSYGRGYVMVVASQEFHVNGLIYTVRSAVQSDARDLFC